jgi:hypothetical protein
MADLKYEVYFMNVPFNSTYNHTVLFNSLNEQINTFKNLGKNNHYTNLNIIIKNSSFIINGGNLEKVSKFNYMMYKSNEDKKWTYSFINEVIFNSYRGTTIYHTIDVWQTYQWYSNWKTALIERGCVANDTIGRWLAPEPVSFSAEFERNINAFDDIDFSPIICVEGVSIPMPSHLIDSVSGEYKDGAFFDYGGVGSGSPSTTFERMSGIYRTVPLSDNNIKKILDEYSRPEWVLATEGNLANPFQLLNNSTYNHIRDVIGYSFIPKFVYNNSIKSSFPDIDGVVIANLINSNSYSSASDTITFANSSLASGYIPKNKKMYTSLARAFKIWNRNGLTIPLAPELMKNLNTSKNLEVSCYMRPYANTMKLHIKDYEKPDGIFLDIPFSYTIMLGQNNNVGVSQQTNIAQIQADFNTKMTRYATRLIDVQTNMATGLTGVGLGAQAMNTQSLMYDGDRFRNMRSGGSMLSGASKSASALSDLMNLGAESNQGYLDYRVSKDNALSSISASVGNTSDTNTLSNANYRLRFADCSPNYDECKVIDDFLSRYGYTIMEFGNLYNWCKTRPHWNYIKTKDANITAEAPNNDIAKFNSIFNNGTTVWHNINEVGDFTLDNTI